MEKYDYILAGGGGAGLCLAFFLHQYGLLRRKRVLIIDHDDKQANDRTWCFWTDRPTAFDPVVSKSWSYLQFHDLNGGRQERLHPYRYQLIRSADFYSFVRLTLAAYPNVRWLKGTVTGLGEDNRGPYACADGRRVYAEWIFNSCRFHRSLPELAGDHLFLWQHFRGWLIETDQPVFDPQTVTLMDFRAPQPGATRFFYVLPWTERRALVEFTAFSPETFPEAEYEQALTTYLRDRLDLKGWRILETEKGRIPMTDVLFPQQLTPRTWNIGTPGGAVKPTTGYAFHNILIQTSYLAQSLARTGRPALPPPKSSRFRFYDRLLLHILKNEPEQAAGIFGRLFHRSPATRILTFMAENSTPAAELPLLASLPWKPFLQAMTAVYLPKFAGLDAITARLRATATAIYSKEWTK